ncbi:hypothetical protein OIO90_002355 [Microbotryomycetes sp. JL221]|nr:hypothetical protein OIO90_002355 [Microbotryomycetes sp. JL221]
MASIGGTNATISSSSPTGPPKLVNLYFVRTVATPKQCFVCHKETTICLANADVSDFLYTCQSHLLDPGFAKPVVPQTSSADSQSSSPTKEGSTVSRTEIDKAISQHKDKEKNKQNVNEQDKDKSAATTTTTTTTTATGVATSLLKTGFSAMSSLASTTHDHLFGSAGVSTTSNSSSTITTLSPSQQMREQAKTAKQFTLHRDIFKMRQDKLKNQYYKKQAKVTVDRLKMPSVPTTLPGSSTS